MSRRYRVAHYGTGQIGKLALRQILDRSEFELVGHLVHTKSKIGPDTGNRWTPSDRGQGDRRL